MTIYLENEEHEVVIESSEHGKVRLSASDTHCHGSLCVSIEGKLYLTLPADAVITALKKARLL